ncbi:tyrosine-protein phosphatase [Catenisphaera adipataccumulans]|uniref:Protein-tyrosine phosphatase n=1 Tax=Catenisphaera adipataccumulans TaxID=700500 RepID=A0A7W8CZ65_9FIRM|nr:tyrosine-protein phosphatase [Catenisphaera adipataccumulans]MBB5183719.1 protein-tyrosine phosphatase [Catenisphaera adipataccumulans]
MENIKLIGQQNARDLGGIQTLEGKTIRKHVFLRSGALNHLTLGDMVTLTKTYDVNTVIDLRTHLETAERPDRIIPNVHYEHIPVFSTSTKGISHEFNDLLDHGRMPDMEQLYKVMVLQPECIQQLKKIFRIILKHEDGAVLWHCSEGKDRAGIVSALFLSMMDVDRQTIYRDYLWTNKAPSRSMDRTVRAVLLRTGDHEKAHAVKEIFSAKIRYMDAAFEAIEQNYGTVTNYLTEALEIPSAEQQAFRSQWTVKKESDR